MFKSIEEDLAKLAQREFKYGEAAVFNSAAANLSRILPSFVGVAVPATLDDFIALIEKDDAGLGPVLSGEINLVISANKAAIEAGVSALVAQGEGYMPAVIKTLQALAAKLQAEANAL